MHKEYKQRWVDALRSSQYQQGQGKLRYPDENGNHIEANVAGIERDV